MFDYTTSKTHRLADSIDLLIDFATLGEYGLEPIGPDPRARKACQGNRRRPRAVQAPVKPPAPRRRDGARHKRATSSGPTPHSNLWAQANTHPSRTRR